MERTDDVNGQQLTGLADFPLGACRDGTVVMLAVGVKP